VNSSRLHIARPNESDSLGKIDDYLFSVH